MFYLASQDALKVVLLRLYWCDSLGRIPTEDFTNVTLVSEDTDDHGDNDDPDYHDDGHDNHDDHDNYDAKASQPLPVCPSVMTKRQ